MQELGSGNVKDAPSSELDGILTVIHSVRVRALGASQNCEEVLSSLRGITPPALSTNSEQAEPIGKLSILRVALAETGEHLDRLETQLNELQTLVS
jgi:hypothetical protein